MSTKRKKTVFIGICLLWLLVTLMMSTTLFLRSAFSSPGTELKVLNLATGDGNFNYYTNTTNTGYQFVANVSVFNINQLAAWQLNITFNPAMLQIVGTNTPDDHVFAGQSIFQGAPEINNTVGYVLWWVALGIGTTPVDIVEGRICQLTFNITAAPSSGGTLACPIHIVMAGETDFYTKLNVDQDGSIVEQTFTSTDGQYRYVSSEHLMPAHLHVNPPRIVDSSLLPCNSFNISVNIQNVTDLYSFEFTMSFNSTLLNATSAELDDFFPPGVTPSVTINNIAGTIQFSASITPPEPAKSGDGILAFIEFHVESLGACNLTLTNTTLLNQYDESILHETADGYLNNMIIAKLAVDPSEIIDPSLVPPKTFEINITIDDVESLYAYKFTLSYDPSIIICVGIIFLDALNETYYIPQFTVNNTEGFIHINVTYYPPSEPLLTYDPVALLTLIFRVKGMGATPLDLHDTNLYDDLRNPISHEANDGFFLAIIRDVAVIDVVTSHTCVYAGCPVNISVTVRNEGNISETFNVKAYYDSNIIGTITVTDLAPDDEITLTFIWDTTSVTPCHNYTIKAEAVPVPYEIDLADNTFIDGSVKIKIIGDVNGDGMVDITDINMSIAAFGSNPGHLRWNPECDFNLDEKVDITDISICIANYGKSC